MNETPLKIEEGIPLPPKHSGRPLKELTIAARAMQVGNSIGNLTMRQARLVAQSLYGCGHKPAIRKMKDGSCRIWRTA